MKPVRSIPAVLAFAALIVLVPLRSRPQTPPRPDQNFQNCVDGFYGCNRKALTAAQREDLAIISQDSNFQDCFNGFADCDHTKLTADERRIVAAAAHDRDLQNCLSGIGECNAAHLSDAE